MGWFNHQLVLIAMGKLCRNLWAGLSFFSVCWIDFWRWRAYSETTKSPNLGKMPRAGWNSSFFSTDLYITEVSVHFNLDMKQKSWNHSYEPRFFFKWHTQVVLPRVFWVPSYHPTTKHGSAGLDLPHRNKRQAAGWKKVHNWGVGAWSRGVFLKLLIFLNIFHSIIKYP